tara:strand:- start:20 stop:148 length:129 start_codon:yes stop_codon:yes gene_type:complete
MRDGFRSDIMELAAVMFVGIFAFVFGLALITLTAWAFFRYLP